MSCRRDHSAQWLARLPCDLAPHRGVGSSPCQGQLPRSAWAAGVVCLCRAVLSVLHGAGLLGQARRTRCEGNTTTFFNSGSQGSWLGDENSKWHTGGLDGWRRGRANRWVGGSFENIIKKSPGNWLGKYKFYFSFFTPPPASLLTAADRTRTGEPGLGKSVRYRCAIPLTTGLIMPLL